MKRLQQTLDIYFDKLKNDYDGLIIVAGDEGKGKSRLILHAIEHWIRITQNREPVAEDVKYITLDKIDFVNELQNPDKYSIVVMDEAGEMASRSAMSRFNKIMTHAFQVIRGLNKLTILILPSLWDIDSFFRRRRARGFIYVYKRGSFAFWSQSRLRKMVALNEQYPVKNYWRTRPTFFDTFPNYKGILLEPYSKLKQKKMEEMVKRLKDEVAKDVEEETVPIRAQIALNLQKKGMSIKDIAEVIPKSGTDDNLSITTIKRDLQTARKAQRVSVS